MLRLKFLYNFGGFERSCWRKAWAVVEFGSRVLCSSHFWQSGLLAVKLKEVFWFKKKCWRLILFKNTRFICAGDWEAEEIWNAWTFFLKLKKPGGNSLKAPKSNLRHRRQGNKIQPAASRKNLATGGKSCFKAEDTPKSKQCSYSFSTSISTYCWNYISQSLDFSSWNFIVPYCWNFFGFGVLLLKFTSCTYCWNLHPG